MKIKGKVKFISQDKAKFFPILKQRVDEYFEVNNISKHANVAMVFKTFILLAGYILPFIALLIFNVSFPASLLLWTIMGISVAGIGMSVMHDANHGAYSSNDTVNYVVGHTLNLAGGSVHNWKLQHNILHHTYTNISGMDEDIADRLVLKFSPHSKVKWYHKFQPVYVFFFYGLLTAYWVFLKDLIQMFQFSKNGVSPLSKKETIIAVLRISLFKIAYIFTLLVVPTLFFSIPLYQVLIGFFLMHFLEGVILSFVFQMAHTVEGTSHPMPNEENTIENDWAVHQMNTTVDFSPKSKIISWYVGGLNFQIEHHLFPRICHVHYPEIAKIVEQTAKEFGVPYMVNETFFKAMKSHLSALKKFGTMPHPNEVIV
jgi:linoleoyl-CoA desaturase